MNGLKNRLFLQRQFQTKRKKTHDFCCAKPYATTTLSISRWTHQLSQLSTHLSNDVPWIAEKTPQCVASQRLVSTQIVSEPIESHRLLIRPDRGA